MASSPRLQTTYSEHSSIRKNLTQRLHSQIAATCDFDEGVICFWCDGDDNLSGWFTWNKSVLESCNRLKQSGRFVCFWVNCMFMLILDKHPKSYSFTSHLHNFLKVLSFILAYFLALLKVFDWFSAHPKSIKSAKSLVEK